MKKKLLFLASLSLILVLLAACSSQTATPTTAPEAQPTSAETTATEAAPAAPEATAETAEATTEATTAATTAATEATSAADVKTGGTLNIGLPGFQTADSIFAADDYSFYVITNIFSSLFRIRDGKIIPDLAESWEYQDDTTVIFHLRKGVMWQDGNEVFPTGKSREVTADDVVYSIKRAVETKGATTPPDLLNSYQSVEAVDPYTVKLTLKAPDVLLFTTARGLTYVTIVPKEAVEKYGDKFGLNPVGSGPFKFVSYKPDDSVVLEANPNYWIKPNLEKVVYKIIPDDNVALIALKKGDIDIYNGPVPTSEVPDLKSDSTISLGQLACPIQTQLLFNMKNPLYSDVKFRQALAYSLDGDSINSNIYGEGAITGAGTAGPKVPGYVADLRDKYFTFDPDKGKELFKELGYEDTDGDGILDKDGKPLELPFEVFNDGANSRFGEAITSQLAAVGIKFNMETVEMGKFLEDWNAGADKIYIMAGWCGDGGTDNLWGETGFAKPLGYDDSDLYALLKEANSTVDAEKRDGILQQATEKIYSQYWAIPTGFNESFLAFRSYVKEYTAPYWFQNLVTVENNVWLDK